MNKKGGGRTIPDHTDSYVWGYSEKKRLQLNEVGPTFSNRGLEEVEIEAVRSGTNA